jgi:Zn-dependent M16 (insulinase) family peptidase
MRKLYGITEQMREDRIAGILAVTQKDLHRTAERLLAAAEEQTYRAIVGSADIKGNVKKITLPF